jgi:hypothetical protein
MLAERIPSLLTAKYVRNLLRAENLAAFDKRFRIVEANPGDQFRESYKKYMETTMT